MSDFDQNQELQRIILYHTHRPTDSTLLHKVHTVTQKAENTNHIEQQ